MLCSEGGKSPALVLQKIVVKPHGDLWIYSRLVLLQLHGKSQLSKGEGNSTPVPKG